MDSASTKLLRIEEVIGITKFSRAKIYQMAASGQIPTLRCGRCVRFPLDRLQRWIADNTTGGEIAS